MSAHLPVLMAARRRYPASGQEAERAAFVAGIAVCQKQAASALSAAIESPDPFPALRSLLSALSQGTEGTGGEAPTVRRIVCWKGREPCPYTCDGIASGRCAPVTGGGPDGGAWLHVDCLHETTPALRARVAHLRGRVDEIGKLGPTCKLRLEVTTAERDAAEAEIARREDAQPETEPGPTERVDMDLRYQYDGGVLLSQGTEETRGERWTDWRCNACGHRWGPRPAGFPPRADGGTVCGNCGSADLWHAPAGAPPATEPGPTERVDMDLRYQYDSTVGFFIIPYEHGGVVAKPPSYVVDLSVRVTYCFSPTDREAAEDVAAVWEARLRERGAKRVEMVGEETER